MFIRSLNLNLRDKHTKVIILIILIALIVAMTLIFTTSFFMLKEKNSIEKETLIFDLNSYHLKGKFKIVSNKNTNTYSIEEFYMKDGSEKEYYKIITEDDKKQKITYIINGENLYIKCENEIYEYRLSKYVDNFNLLSISTFINAYKDIAKENIQNNFASIQNINIDDTTRYKIVFNISEKKEIENKMQKKYLDIINSGFSISKMELVIDNLKSEPIQYIAYDAEGKAAIDIDIAEFNINKKIDEKIFAF